MAGKQVQLVSANEPDIAAAVAAASSQLSRGKSGGSNVRRESMSVKRQLSSRTADGDNDDESAQVKMSMEELESNRTEVMQEDDSEIDDEDEDDDMPYDSPAFIDTSNENMYKGVLPPAIVL